MAVKDMLRRALAALTAPTRRSAPSGARPAPPTSPKPGKPPRRGEPGHAVPRPTGKAPSSDLRDLDGIAISYAPVPGREADPGEVVWTWVPYEDDPKQGKDRPVVIFGRRGVDLVGVALTTKSDHPDQVLVGTGAWDPQHRPSYAKLERILDVEPDKVRRVGGVLDRKRFDDLVAALRHFYP